jgi:cytochrome c oxidase assembly factor CtaG
MSPIDVLSGQYFFMHMIQHLLIVMIAAPLLLLANPMPIMLWGLPETLRLEVGRWLRPGTTFRNTVRAATTPGLVWIYFVVVLVGWHDANAYDATLRYDLVHDIEHLSFFFTAILFWWHVTGAAPHIHRRLSRGLRIGYALSAVPPTALTGLAIAFASEPIYTYYTTVPRLGAMTVMEDQMLGGVIMWVPGSMMYIIAALILIARAMRDEEQEEPWVETQRILSDDEAMRAPGFEESPLQDTGDWGEGQGLGTHSPPSASGGPA